MITGSVPDLRDRTILTVEFGRIKGGHLLRSWLNLLALTCHQPNSRQAVLIAPGSRPCNCAALRKLTPGRSSVT